MPRPMMTPANRDNAVASAINALPGALDAASALVARHGYSDARVRTAFEEVERLGAIVHRQSRLLAGKSKGG